MSMNVNSDKVDETTTVGNAEPNAVANAPVQKSVKKGKTAKKAPKTATQGKSMKNAKSVKTAAKSVTRKAKPKDVITTVTLKKGEIPPEGYTRVRETRRGVIYQKMKKGVTNSNMNSLADEFAKISGLGKAATMVAHEPEAVHESANKASNSVDKLANLFGSATLGKKNKGKK